MRETGLHRLFLLCSFSSQHSGVCVCERERERERVCVCVCERETGVCVCERERKCVCVCERERDRHREAFQLYSSILFVAPPEVCVCASV